MFYNFYLCDVLKTNSTDTATVFLFDHFPSIYHLGCGALVSNFLASGSLYTLKMIEDFYLGGLYLLIFVILEIETEKYLKYKNIQLYERAGVK